MVSYISRKLISIGAAAAEYALSLLWNYVERVQSIIPERVEIATASTLIKHIFRVLSNGYWVELSFGEELYMIWR